MSCEKHVFRRTGVGSSWTNLFKARPPVVTLPNLLEKTDRDGGQWGLGLLIFLLIFGGCCFSINLLVVFVLLYFSFSFPGFSKEWNISIHWMAHGETLPPSTYFSPADSSLPWSSGSRPGVVAVSVLFWSISGYSIGALLRYWYKIGIGIRRTQWNFVSGLEYCNTWELKHQLWDWTAKNSIASTLTSTLSTSFEDGFQQICSSWFCDFKCPEFAVCNTSPCDNRDWSRGIFYWWNFWICRHLCSPGLWPQSTEFSNCSIFIYCHSG